MPLIRRLIAYTRIRLVEIELADRQAQLAQATDSLIRTTAEIEIDRIRQRLTRARGDYQSLFPPGRRFIWQQA